MRWTRSFFTRSIAARSEQCVLTCVTINCSEASMMVTSRAPHTAPISSVWPVNPGSDSCVASLLMGSVTMAAISPASAARAAAITYSRAAAPDFALILPGVMSASLRMPRSMTFRAPSRKSSGALAARSGTA